MRTFTKYTHNFPEMKHPALHKREGDIFCFCVLVWLGLMALSVNYLTNYYFN